MDSRIKGIFTEEKTYFGYRLADLIGIGLMIIPVIITLYGGFSYTERKWIVIKQTKQYTGLLPGPLAMMFSFIFYAAFIVRFDMFKTKTLVHIVISVIRTFLNCWAVAGLMNTIIDPKEVGVFHPLQNNKVLFMLMAIVLTWVGMRTVAGYCWVLFVIAAFPGLQRFDEATGIWGAIFIFLTAVSLLLQISSHDDLKQILTEFRGTGVKAVSQAYGGTAVPGSDRVNRIEQTPEYVYSETIGSPRAEEAERVKPQYHISNDGEVKKL